MYSILWVPDYHDTLRRTPHGPVALRVPVGMNVDGEPNGAHTIEAVGTAREARAAVAAHQESLPRTMLTPGRIVVTGDDGQVVAEGALAWREWEEQDREARQEVLDMAGIARTAI